ncbi:phospholipid carrier-dependent glycosyltransferase [Actinotalea sp. C106]|uniref:dolichyl-phosphate-mannose--protein mannosyltransferase n=1 Tax=Actinotalea sp. C106 TaxID=2908644 RepID=UPI002028160A|nr:phospholipid carrier-dependent glycosyltransferase [Actinotalea sp. C106]
MTSTLPAGRAASDRRRGPTGPRGGSGREALWGWVTALAVTALAAAMRLRDLGRPEVLVFDETYYVKDAWTLLHLGYEGSWPDDPDPAFESGQVDGYSTAPAYVVHPPVGKWVIALGLRLVGAQDPAGWRLGSALAGVLAVLLLTRIATRLFRSAGLGAIAGLLLAVDGAAIVHSRTALLDGILMVLLLAAFGALLLDRDRTGERLARQTGPPWAHRGWGPGLGLRPWRVTAGLLLGLAVGTKWSALWFVAVFGLLTVGWDFLARHRSGASRWWQTALLRDGPLAFLSVVGTAAVSYVAGWAGWFATQGGYARTWAATHPGEGVTWLPGALRSWVHYHQEMWRFHTSLTTEHGYASHPAGWLLQLRPTSFFFESPEPPLQVCGAERCAQTVTSLGNPLLWWFATAAVVACVWWVVRRRDGVALAALSGLAAGWLPWFAYSHRTIFAFYAIVVLPWMVLCLTWAIGRLLAWGEAEPWRRTMVRGVVVVGLVLVLLTTAWFLPVWTGEVTTFREWQLRQWWHGWV